MREAASASSFEERAAHNIPTPLTIKLTDLGATSLWPDARRLARREAEVVWETATRLFATERIDAMLDVAGIDAERTLDAVDAFVEVGRRILDVVGGRDEYARTSARFGISVRVAEAPFFRLGRLAETLQAHGVSPDSADMLLSEILSGITTAEHGTSTTEYSATHDLPLVEANYAAWRRRYLATLLTNKP